MNDWKREYNELKTTLEKFGWQCLKREVDDLEEWYSQGVLYANFTKENKAIHIEYGDRCSIFGEAVEE